jgi:hypothetical protein
VHGFMLSIYVCIVCGFYVQYVCVRGFYVQHPLYVCMCGILCSACTYVCACACMHVCVCVLVYVCMYVSFLSLRKISLFFLKFKYSIKFTIRDILLKIDQISNARIILDCVCSFAKVWFLL